MDESAAISYRTGTVQTQLFILVFTAILTNSFRVVLIDAVHFTSEIMHNL